MVNHTLSDPGGMFRPLEKDRIQLCYDQIRSLEPLITSDMLKLEKALQVKFSGLEFSVKTGSSISDKLARSKEKCTAQRKPFVPGRELRRMKDVIRYTEICSHDEIISKTNDTIKQLEQSGYILSGCKNYYRNPFPSTGYMGVHLNFITPYGQEIELQVHSEESFQAKQEGHSLYEKIRSVSTLEKDKDALLKEIRQIHGQIDKPKEYETLKDFTLRGKERIIQDRQNHMSFEMGYKKGDKVQSMAYTVKMDGKPILHGFENTQSDGSVFFYRNNSNDIHMNFLKKRRPLTGRFFLRQ